MAFQPETPTWEVGIYQFETTDYVEGGLGGIDNQPLLQLANRTAYLKQETGSISDDVTALKTSKHQGVRNTVLTGRALNGVEAYFDAASADTMRITASPSNPLIFTVSGGFDLEGEIIYNVQITSNREFYDVGTGLRYGILFYNPTTGVVNLEVAFELYVTSSPPSPNVARRFWYDPITAKSYWSNGTSWDQVYAAIVGQWNIVGGNIDSNSVRTYPTRSQMYDDSIEAGTVVAVAGNEQPRGGYIYCNGAAVSRSQYARLFSRVGTLYGAGDGTSTFNLPDLRSEFIRGFDDGRGIDTGRVLGSAQSGLVGPHSHGIKIQYHSITTGSATTVATIDPTQTNILSTENNTGTETRPRNVAMKYWIKF